jgi:predicted regulator of Ras-like GTPase activity (Roadblock/LC7/MglB family)
VFQPTLQRVVERADGALGAAVLSLDGLVIEAVDGQGASVPPAAAMATYGPVFKQLLGIGDAVDLGAIERFTVSTGAQTHLVRMLDRQYLAVLTVGPNAIEGQAHFHLRVVAPDLARSL